VHTRGIGADAWVTSDGRIYFVNLTETVRSALEPMQSAREEELSTDRHQVRFPDLSVQSSDVTPPV
jgi:hypothetical protein